MVLIDEVYVSRLFSDLFAVLQQDVVELLHHLRVDGLPGADVLELEQHVEGALGRPQRLEGLVDEVLGLVLDGGDLLVEPLHDLAPLELVLEAEGFKVHLEIEESKRKEFKVHLKTKGTERPSHGKRVYLEKPCSEKNGFKD